MFLYSLKLFGSNWGKALKFFLCYVVVWGICAALFVPCILQFRAALVDGFKDVSGAFNGVFQVAVGQGLHNLILTSFEVLKTIFAQNLGVAIYGAFVAFVLLPFLVNVAKYTFCEMLYSYMTSKAKIGFFHALARGLKKSIWFAIVKTVYNIIFIAIVLLCVYGLGCIENEMFVKYFLPIVLFAALVVLFTLEQISVVGWMPALIVFDCNVFVAYKRGFKAVKRHFWATLGTTALYFVLLWAFVILFGFYTLAVLVPLVTALLCVFNMTAFFSSQGMRFYFTKNTILTPKKLEEVDNINKTAYIL